MGAFDVTFDQCAFGAETKKPTQILTNIEELMNLQGSCPHGPGAHQVLEGVDAEGNWRTAAASLYPSLLCRSLAAAFLESRSRTADDRDDDKEEKSKDYEVTAKALKKVPPIAECWSPSKDGRRSSVASGSRRTTTSWASSAAASWSFGPWRGLDKDGTA